MSKRYPGGLITKTPVVPTSLSAPGIWSLSDQAAAQATNTWPFPRDPQFNYVTMLLHGDGSAGAVAMGSGAGTSSTVTNFNADASTNNFNVTINGDARSNNFTPYQGTGYYSNYFDGSSAYLSIATNAGFGMGTGDCTLECWYFPLNSTVGIQTLINIRTTNTGVPVNIGVTASGAPYAYNGTQYSGSTVSNNSWNHIALVRNGSGTNNCKLYLNGTQVTQFTDTADWGSTDTCVIGRNTGLATEYAYGYISNARVVKGTAVYTAAFTPSTTPLTAVSGTSLLTCQSNRFVDNSASPLTITVNGSPQVSPAIPFTLPSSVATYGSGYFDGTGDYLGVTGATTALAFGSGDFTIELWAYILQTTPEQMLIDWRPAGTQTTQPLIYVTSAGVLAYYVSAANRITGATLITGQWYHIAVSRSGTSTKMFLNGVQTGSTYTDTTVYTNTSTRPLIGLDGNTGNSGYLKGNVTDVRTLTGTALYTTTFTPPTTPLTAITNTSLLTTQFNGGGNNSGFKDSGPFNFPITRNGNTTQGTFTPYSADWSNYFDGTGDRLTVPANAAFNFSTGDFTVECWFYTNSVSANQWIVGPDNTVTYPWVLQTSGSTIRFLSNNAANIFSPTSFTLTVGTWNHFAVTRSGSTMYWFTNGTLNGTQTYSTAIGSNTIDVQIGTTGSGSGDPVNGYISNLRVVKGTAVYTSSFTPSTTPLTAITNTSLLTCQSNRFIDNSSNAFTITKYNDVSVQGFSPFAPLTVYNPATNGGSMYMDGTTDFVKTPSDANLSSTLLASNFTIECWIYVISLPNAPSIWTNSVSNSDGFSGSYVQTNGTIGTGKFGVNEFNTTNAIKLNSWNHFALVRNSGTLYVYLNGVQDPTTGAASTYLNTSATKPMQIGSSNQTSPAALNGYISDFRVVTSALYTASFTVNTTPLTVVTGTNLLLNTTNPAILDNSMLNNLETVGNAQISTSVKKYGAASMYFEGTSPYGYLKGNANLSQNVAFGTGDFTVECWVYLTTTASDSVIMDARPGSNSANYFLFYLWTNAGAQQPTIAWYSPTSYVLSTGTVSSGTWTHIAICRASGTIRSFKDGVLQQSASDTRSYLNPGAPYPYIGAGYSVTIDSFKGYIDDFRITKYARYTANFTVPDQAFPNG